MKIDVKQMDRETKDDLAGVLEATNRLEEQAASVIRQACLPPIDKSTEREHVMFTFLMHNTIVSLGGKISVVAIILEHFGWWNDLKGEFGSLHDVLRLRNAFAHTHDKKGLRLWPY